MRLKLKLIIIPILTMFILLSGAFVLFMWLWLTQFSYYTFNKFTVEFIIPGVITLVAGFFIHRRLKLLKYPESSGRGDYYMLATSVLSLCLFLTFYNIHGYSKISFSEKGEVTDFNEVAPNSNARYIKADSVNIDSNIVLTSYDFSTTDRGSDLNFTFVCVSPIITDTIKSFWLGNRSRLKMRTRESDEEIDRKATAFANACIEEFKKSKFSKGAYYERGEESVDGELYIKALQDGKVLGMYPNSKVYIVFSGTPTSQAKSNITGLLCFSIGFIFALLISTVASPLDEKKIRDLETGKAKPWWHIGADAKRMIIPGKGFIVTPLIIDINIIVFIVGLFIGSGFFDANGKVLLEMGAISKHEILQQGQWWRLITAVFLHANIAHIAFNLFTFIFLSLFLELRIGSWRFLILYLLVGLGASYASLYYNDHTSVGASGAIFGIGGFSITLGLLSKISRFSNYETILPYKIVAGLIGVNLLFGLLHPMIDNAAHIGGLLTGVAIGVVYVLTGQPFAPFEEVSGINEMN